MSRISVRGLVRLSQLVRRELLAPMTPQRRASLRELVRRNTSVVEDLLRREGLTVQHLSPQSRSALCYLRSLDLDALPRCGPDPSLPAAPPAETVRITGLPSRLDEILNALGAPGDRPAQEDVFAAIQREHRHIERLLGHRRIASSALRPQHRLARGWLAYFADSRHFEACTRALDRARPALERAAWEDRRVPPALWIHFRPTRGQYRMRWDDRRTVVHLPTPMICFEQEAMQSLAELIFRRAPRSGALLERMQQADYRAVQAELDRAAGEVARNQGATHDLGASFDRVNLAYFEGNMPEPRLTWSDRVALCKFGHYDFTRDEVQISAALDAPNVPVYVLDCVMHHELLHKRHGLKWRSGRGHAHTREFRADERRFTQQAEADQFLSKLARTARGG